jgi:hypothetical protein
MSLTFTQIVNKIQRATGLNTANYSLADIAIDVNLAQDEVWAEALKNNGWNIDDFNQPDYPIIYTDLASGQRDYSFIRDENDSMVLDIYKVQVMGEDGIYRDLKPVDQQSSDVQTSMTDGQEATGIPTSYDKTANGIFLDLVPSYDKALGLKVFIDREPTYFVSTDTTKVSGIDPLCHDYLYLKPSYEVCRDKGKPNAEKIYRDLQVSMAKIKERYGTREKDVVRRAVPMRQNNH